MGVLLGGTCWGLVLRRPFLIKRVVGGGDGSQNMGIFGKGVDAKANRVIDLQMIALAMTTCHQQAIRREQSRPHI